VAVDELLLPLLDGCGRYIKNEKPERANACPGWPTEFARGANARRSEHRSLGMERRLRSSVRYEAAPNASYGRMPRRHGPVIQRTAATSVTASSRYAGERRRKRFLALGALGLNISVILDAHTMGILPNQHDDDSALTGPATWFHSALSASFRMLTLQR